MVELAALRLRGYVRELDGELRLILSSIGKIVSSELCNIDKAEGVLMLVDDIKMVLSELNINGKGGGKDGGKDCASGSC